MIIPEIEVLSNLEGISIDLPEPLTKSKDSKVSFRLTFGSTINEPPLLRFKYGDLFRGKFKFKNNITEGFIIAGKEKQSYIFLTFIHQLNMTVQMGLRMVLQRLK